MLKAKNPPKFPFLKTDGNYNVITNRNVSEIIKQDGSYKVVENGHYDNGFTQAFLLQELPKTDQFTSYNSLVYLNMHADMTNINTETSGDWKDKALITSIPSSVKSIDFPYWGNWCDNKIILMFYSGSTTDNFYSPFIKNTTLEEICFPFDYLPESDEDINNEEIKIQGIKNMMTGFGYDGESVDSSYWDDANENEEKEREMVGYQYKYWLVPLGTIIDGMQNDILNSWIDCYGIEEFVKEYGDNTSWFDIPIEDRLNFF